MRIIPVLAVGLLVLASPTAAAPPSVATPPPAAPATPLPAGLETLPPGPDRDLVQRVCTACHSAEVFANKDPDQTWFDVVQLMSSRGAAATPAELGQIAAYLDRTVLPPSGGPGAGR